MFEHEARPRDVEGPPLVVAQWKIVGVAGAHLERWARVRPRALELGRIALDPEHVESGMRVAQLGSEARGAAADVEHALVARES